MAIYLVWFKGRNTPHVVNSSSRSEAMSKARNSGKAGASKGIVAARKANESEAKQARAGRWVRSRSNGSSPTGDKESRKKASRYKSAYRSGPAKQSSSS